MRGTDLAVWGGQDVFQEKQKAATVEGAASRRAI